MVIAETDHYSNNTEDGNNLSRCGIHSSESKAISNLSISLIQLSTHSSGRRTQFVAINASLQILQRYLANNRPLQIKSGRLRRRGGRMSNGGGTSCGQR